MKKVFTIGMKDLKIAFRDRAALIMLAAPFVLTLAMGLVTGSFSFSESGDEGIPIAVVNKDRGEFGSALVAFLTDESMAELVHATVLNSKSEAENEIVADSYAAAIIIPAEFSESLIQSDGSDDAQSGGVIEILANPGQPINANIVRTVIDRFITQVETGIVSSQVAVMGLIESGIVSPQEAYNVGREIGERQVLQSGGGSLIQILGDRPIEEEAAFNPLAIIAPGMAMLFLMYTVSNVGGRSILTEREEGTLPRMLTTPSGSAQVLGGKVLGIMLVGIAQVGILILASSLLFQLKWGDPLAVAVLIVAAVAGATGWGILLAAFAKTPGQVTSIGAALMLLFGLLGGSFFGGVGFTGVMRTISRMTPNGWAAEGFFTLAQGGTFADLVEPLAALIVMALVLFAIAVVVFQRRGIARA
ncbi:MAG: ABC transporter permease [Anaerolineales bacterium]|nr:ABC transporter permease [Anaerolineales bacterium]